jgi:hypothetical protein
MYRFSNPFRPRGVLRLARRHPRLYLTLTLLLGLCGYAFVLMFPLLLIGMPIALSHTLKPLMTAQDWFLVTVEALLLALGAVVTYVLFTMRFAPPSGLKLRRRDCPRLFEVLDELRQEYGNPPIDRVVLRDRFDLRVIRTPRNGLPFRVTHTLVIGLPVLLTLSPLDVHVLVARRIGQLAGRNSRMHSWLFHLRDMWAQYLGGCGSRGLQPMRPLCGFFRAYVPLYRAFSVPLARSSELDADRYALQAMNDRDTARAISNQVLTEFYLNHTFWPGIIETARQSVKPDALPHAKMAQLFAGGLSEQCLLATLEQVRKRPTAPRAAMPDLATRLEHIGHRKALLPKALAVSAAGFYLGGAVEGCIQVVDRRAQKKVRSKVIKKCSGESC